MSNIEERVIKMVAEQLGVKEEDVKVTSSFVEDLGADSLDTVELSWRWKKNLMQRSLMRRLRKLPLSKMRLPISTQIVRSNL